MIQDKLTKILINFGNKWVEASNHWNTKYIAKRKRELLKWIIKKLFLKH